MGPRREKRTYKHPSENRAVSKVVGVVLMTAIVIALVVLERWWRVLRYLNKPPQ